MSYWLLPAYSSTTKEVKSGATSYPARLTYIPIGKYTYIPLVLSHNSVLRESSMSGGVVQSVKDRWSHVTATWTNNKRTGVSHVGDTSEATSYRKRKLNIAKLLVVTAELIETSVRCSPSNEFGYCSVIVTIQVC